MYGVQESYQDSDPFPATQCPPLGKDLQVEDVISRVHSHGAALRATPVLHLSEGVRVKTLPTVSLVRAGTLPTVSLVRAGTLPTLSLVRAGTLPTVSLVRAETLPTVSLGGVESS